VFRFTFRSLKHYRSLPYPDSPRDPASANASVSVKRGSTRVAAPLSSENQRLYTAIGALIDGCGW
jgi:hypothetical protein